MSQLPKKQPERNVEAHIYMTPSDKALLEKYAQKACRSVNGQILYYIQHGIMHDKAYYK